MADRTLGTRFWSLTEKAANTWAVVIPFAIAVSSYFAGIAEQVADFAEPWRTLTIIGTILFLVALVPWFLVLGRRIFRGRSKGNGTRPSHVGYQVSGSNLLAGNLAIMGGTPEKVRPPKERGPNTPEVLDRLAERLEQLVERLHEEFAAHDPLRLAAWEINAFSPESRALYEARQREWDDTLSRLFDRVVALYEEAVDRGYAHPQMEHYWAGWRAGGAYEEYPAWLSSIAQRLRDDAADARAQASRGASGDQA